MAADGSELSSKRVLKLSRRYHLHKKQLRQSAMMAEGLSDAWMCPSCSHENQDYQRCMGPGCDVVRPGSLLDTALSTQPPSIGHRSTISVAMNHPAAAARRGAKKPLPPRRESPGRNCKRSANAHTTEMCRVGGPRHPPRSRLPPCPPSVPPHPLAPRRKSSTVVDDLIVVAAGEDGSRHGARPPSLPPRPPSRSSTTPIATRKSPPLDHLVVVAAGEQDGSHHGGEEEGVATTRRVGGDVSGEVLDISSVDSSDDEVVSVQSSVQNSVQLYGNGVQCDSPPDFEEHNDPVHDSPTDNEVSKYSFYSRLTHYMEGNKITETNRAAVELCILSEAGAFVRNMDPMKKEKKERVFFSKYLSIIDEIEDDQFDDTDNTVRENMRRMYKGAKKDNTPKSLWRKYEVELTCLRTFAKQIPGIGNLAELPSGSTQLRQMKIPLVQKLWKQKNPVSYLFRDLRSHSY